MAPRAIQVGDRVRLLGIPPEVAEMPEDPELQTRRVFAICLGRIYRVVGIGRYGHLELDVSADVDPLVGGFMNSIWVEPELLELQPEEPAARSGR